MVECIECGKSVELCGGREIVFSRKQGVHHACVRDAVKNIFRQRETLLEALTLSRALSPRERLAWIAGYINSEFPQVADAIMRDLKALE